MGEAGKDSKESQIINILAPKAKTLSPFCTNWPAGLELFIFYDMQCYIQYTLHAHIYIYNIQCTGN